MNEDLLAKLFYEAQEGNRDSYRLFLEEVGVLLERSLRKYIPGADLEDIVQETLFAIHHAKHTYLPSRPLLPWIFAIGKNKAIDYLRKMKRKNEIPILEHDFEQVENFPLEEELRIDDLMKGMQQLPAKQKFILEQMKLNDRSVREVAKELNMSESAVKVSASRAYEKLRQWFQKEKK